ncbi:MBL fold metallo-hydrolase [Mycoplasma sp. P36-A1]|uniref:MBL fold metallo-hydrolase n=1 Tax=Mycoplasma sp. P36-A1 TaxID=3252900 RepID=UPI003C2EB69C
MKIETIVDNNSFMVNTYVLYENDTALVIDPGADFHTIKTFLNTSNITKISIFLTHGHVDHIFSLEQLAKEYNATVYIHEKDEHLLYDSKANCSSIFGMPMVVKDIKVNTVTDKLVFNQYTFQVIHVPGHTPGQSMLLVKDQNALFSGDFLFNNGIGRYDLPGGDGIAMKKSLEVIYTLNPNLKVYPGHGATTTIKEELKNNPYL